MKRPTVIIERFIPDVPDEIAEAFDVVRLAPEQITAEAVAKAQALIVRTRTRCNQALLGGSDVEFVATATIGTDHIDAAWTAAHGIETVSAPGCNAPAVAQYVYASLLRVSPNLRGKVIGIVGVGHVGSIVAATASRLGLRPLLCDPPRARREGSDGFVSLDRIASEADIVTFHVPHTTTGDDATHHIADSRFFGALRRRPIVINSARGPIVDTPALIAAIKQSRVRDAIIDCWEGEPDINRELLGLAAIATPHIAGYSIEGKHRATYATLSALYRHFGLTAPASLEALMPKVDTNAHQIDGDQLAAQVLRDYNPEVDAASLRSAPTTFEQLRNGYHLRRETSQISYPTNTQSNNTI